MGSFSTGFGTGFFSKLTNIQDENAEEGDALRQAAFRHWMEVGIPQYRQERRQANQINRNAQLYKALLGDMPGAEGIGLELAATGASIEDVRSISREYSASGLIPENVPRPAPTTEETDAALGAASQPMAAPVAPASTARTTPLTGADPTSFDTGRSFFDAIMGTPNPQAIRDNVVNDLSVLYGLPREEIVKMMSTSPLDEVPHADLTAAGQQLQRNMVPARVSMWKDLGIQPDDFRNPGDFRRAAEGFLLHGDMSGLDGILTPPEMAAIESAAGGDEVRAADMTAARALIDPEFGSFVTDPNTGLSIYRPLSSEKGLQRSQVIRRAMELIRDMRLDGNTAGAIALGEWARRGRVEDLRWGQPPTSPTVPNAAEEAARRWPELTEEEKQQTIEQLGGTGSPGNLRLRDLLIEQGIITPTISPEE